MFRNKHFAMALAFLVVIAFFAIIFDADAYSCSSLYNAMKYYYSMFLDALGQYGWDHPATQYYYSEYQYYRYLYYTNCGGG